jgi:hypothetical protein
MRASRNCRGKSSRLPAAGLVVLVAFGLLVFAPAAQAAMGVYDNFAKNGTKGGEFTYGSGIGLKDPAVNGSGAGGANPGDVYFADRANNRVQRFDADGHFISAFGQDVVGSGPDNNGISYEVCKASAGDVCKAGIAPVSGSATGGAISEAGTIAVDQQSGNIYVGDVGFRRIQEFSATGAFVRAWGRDVVKAGQPGDNPVASAQQTLTVTASAGKYTLEFEGQKTAELSFNSSATEIQAALTGLSTIGVGNAEVSGAGPFTIKFKGLHANNPEPDIVAASGLGDPLVGGAASLVTSTLGSNGFEICNVAADCQGSPANAGTAGGFNTVGNSVTPILVAPASAPNAGDVLVADVGNRRVLEFTATGAFVRAFGWDVVAIGPGNDNTAPANQFEVCRAAAFDACRSGSNGLNVGQFTASTTSIAEDATGTIYAVDSFIGFQVQRFTLPGNVVTPNGLFDPGELSGTSVDTIAGTANYPVAIAVDTGTAPGTLGTVYVLKYFSPGSGSPAMPVQEARLLKVDPEANGGSGKVVATFGARAEIGSKISGFAGGLALNSVSSRLYATDSSSSVPVYIFDEVPPISASLDPVEVGATTATLKATITPLPIPLPTLYRFEYSKAGTGEWKSAPSGQEANIGNMPSPVQVSQTIEGLGVGQTYEYRLVAHTQFYGTVNEVTGASFKTQPIAPVVQTGAAYWSSPASTKPSLTLRGSINPGNDQTDFFFQYASEEQFQASGFTSAKVAPALPAPAGRGLSAVEVLWSITGLDPSKSYRYRLVATNSVGTSTGTERTIARPDSGARFYELISNADSFGNQVADIIAVSDDGARAAISASSLGDSQTLPNQLSPFLAGRGEDGWGVSSIMPDPAHAESGIQHALPDVSLPADLSTALWSNYSSAERIRGEFHWTFTDPDGGLRPALPVMVPVTGSGSRLTTMKLGGASAGLSTFVFQREESSAPGIQATYLPGQPLTTGDEGDIYRISGAAGPSPTLALVNRDPAGNLISNSCGAWIGSFNLGRIESIEANRGLNLRPVSADGAVTYFSARPSGSTVCSKATDRIRVFKRIGDSATVEVSKAQCTPGACSATNGDDFFQGASADGNRVFFTTTRQLVDGDDDATSDLYLYDSSPPAGQPNLVQASAKAGVEARVQESVVDIAVDGSRAYFVAEGQLATGAVASSKNLFVYQRDDAHPLGRLAFVTKLAGDDERLWRPGGKAAFAMPFSSPTGQAAGDGHLLLFGTRAKLVAGDTDSAVDLYRFNDEGAGLICLTCAGNGSFDVAVRFHLDLPSPSSTQQSRIASEDGSSVVFATVESLLAADQNSVADAYLWHEGALSLISPGNAGSSGVVSDVGGEGPMLSADGSTVYFLTTDRLLASDYDSARDAYAARIGGGFPEAEQAQTCVSPDECRTAPVVPSSAPSAGSGSFTGPGNVHGAAKCPKGKVRKKGRCVKKSGKAHEHRHSHQRRANNDRGGKR